MVILWLVTFVFLSRFIPVPAPSKNPQQVVEMLRDRTNLIRLGLAVTVFAVALLVPFAALISTQLKRIEGDRGPLASTQLCSAALLSLEFMIPIMIWQTALFRVNDTAADFRVIQMLNDMGWLFFVAPIFSVVCQMVAIGIAILLDQRPDPVFPRWAGYFNIWVGLLLSPASAVVFFKDGPLAWNGVLGFYTPLAAYTPWFFVMIYLLRRAINQEEAEQQQISPRTLAPRQ